MVLLQKWPYFQLFFSGNLVQENVCYDILERNNVFLAQHHTFICFFYLTLSLRKQPTLCDTITGFHVNWRLSNKCSSSILMTHHYLPGQCYWSAKANFPLGTTNQKHYPLLSSDMSSVWNVCAIYSDVILRGNQWWRRKMSAVFSG